MGFCSDHGFDAFGWCFGLQEVCRVFAIRDHHWTGQFDLCNLTDVHQRMRISHSDGLLPEDVLGHKGQPGMEHE